MRRALLILMAVLLAALAALALFLAARVPSKAPLKLGTVERITIEAGIEVVDGELVRGDESAGRIVVLYADPVRATPEIHINEGQDPLAVLERDALAVINAGFFTPERRATGLLVSKGHVLSPLVPKGGSAGSGVFVQRDGVLELLERDRAKGLTFTPTTFAVQAGPRIIEPGGHPGIRSDDGAHANRTVLGADGRGWLAIALVLGSAGWASGPTLFELQSLLTADGLGKEHKDLAFAFALNLDGGPSTGMHLRSAHHAVSAPESAPVHSFISISIGAPKFDPHTHTPDSPQLR